MDFLPCLNYHRNCTTFLLYPMIFFYLFECVDFCWLWMRETLVKLAETSPFAIKLNRAKVFPDLIHRINFFFSAQLQEIRKSSWARIMCDNGDHIKHVQPLAMRSVSKMWVTLIIYIYIYINTEAIDIPFGNRSFIRKVKTRAQTKNIVAIFRFNQKKINFFDQNFLIKSKYCNYVFRLCSCFNFYYSNILSWNIIEEQRRRFESPRGQMGFFNDVPLQNIAI